MGMSLVRVCVFLCVVTTCVMSCDSSELRYGRVVSVLLSSNRPVTTIPPTSLSLPHQVVEIHTVHTEYIENTHFEIRLYLIFV